MGTHNARFVSTSTLVLTISLTCLSPHCLVRNGSCVTAGPGDPAVSLSPAERRAFVDIESAVSLWTFGSLPLLLLFWRHSFLYNVGLLTEDIARIVAGDSLGGYREDRWHEFVLFSFSASTYSQAGLCWGREACASHGLSQRSQAIFPLPFEQEYSLFVFELLLHSTFSPLDV